jgi:hypothetical protein
MVTLAGVPMVATGGLSYGRPRAPPLRARGLPPSRGGGAAGGGFRLVARASRARERHQWCQSPQVAIAVYAQIA